MNQTQVVAAVIKENNRYLIVQRNRNKHLGLKWEFPGGKVGSKESFKKALIREIKEELNITISVREIIAQETVSDWYNTYPNERIIILSDPEAMMKTWVRPTGYPSIILVDENMNLLVHT